jgi:hypothetical protein
MARRNRKTLKNYFALGALPTQSHFEDLVDSTLNIMEDGFSRSAANGIEISLVGEQSRLLSFFCDAQQMEKPDWSITCELQSGNLNFVQIAGQTAEDASSSAQDKVDSDQETENPLLTLTEEGRVGIKSTSPAFDLDVNGTIRSTGRFGRSGVVPADGEWHAITPKLDGCHALEIIAGVGLSGKKKGRYAFLHAIAMNTYNPTGWFFNFLNQKKKIRCTHAWYLSRADRMKLRWVKVDAELSHAYQLELKTLTSYGDEINIQFSVTELWSDWSMENSQTDSGGSKT